MAFYNGKVTQGFTIPNSAPGNQAPTAPTIDPTYLSFFNSSRPAALSDLDLFSDAEYNSLLATPSSLAPLQGSYYPYSFTATPVQDRPSRSEQLPPASGKAPRSTSRPSRKASTPSSSTPALHAPVSAASSIPMSLPSQASSWSSSTPISYRSEADHDIGWTPSHPIAASAPVLPDKLSRTLDNVQEEDASSNKVALLTEKRRKRRESHNAVERRRRDNINDRIADLSCLLPEALITLHSGKDDDGELLGAVEENPPSHQGQTQSFAFTQATIVSGGLIGTLGMGRDMIKPNNGATVNGLKPNKGSVLRMSVEYIRYLQQTVELHLQRTEQLETLVQELRAGQSPASTSSGRMADGLTPSDIGSPMNGIAHAGNEGNAWDFMSFSHMAEHEQQVGDVVMS